MVPQKGQECNGTISEWPEEGSDKAAQSKIKKTETLRTYRFAASAGKHIFHDSRKSNVALKVQLLGRCE